MVCPEAGVVELVLGGWGGATLNRLVVEGGVSVSPPGWLLTTPLGTKGGKLRSRLKVYRGSGNAYYQVWREALEVVSECSSLLTAPRGS